ncbi:Protein TRANSPARENT TESTA 12 [Hordeum vulgare]|nr:Protein TRANSPARENT TESTA 12 [Hordeum vulgare]
MSSVDVAGPLGRCPADPWYSSRTWYWVCWVLVHKVGLGSKGAALASAVSYSTNLAILCLYTRLSGACRRTWTGLFMEAFAFKELRQFAELAVPSAMMVCLEWWSFELLVLLSGLLPNPKLETSVLSICLNTGALMFTVPSDVCAAISTRVSIELGAGRPQHIADVILTQFDRTREVPTTLLLYLPTTTTTIQSILSRALSATLVRIPIASLLFGNAAGNLSPNLMFELFAMYREWQEEMAKEISGRQLPLVQFLPIADLRQRATFLAHADNGH